LEISSACNILAALGILEQAPPSSRSDTKPSISSVIPDPALLAENSDNYLALISSRWSKIITSLPESYISNPEPSINNLSAEQPNNQNNPSDFTGFPAASPTNQKSNTIVSGYPVFSIQQDKSSSIIIQPSSSEVADSSFVQSLTDAKQDSQHGDYPLGTSQGEDTDMDFVDLLLEGTHQMELLPENSEVHTYNTSSGLDVIPGLIESTLLQISDAQNFTLSSSNPTHSQSMTLQDDCFASNLDLGFPSNEELSVSAKSSISAKKVSIADELSQSDFVVGVDNNKTSFSMLKPVNPRRSASSSKIWRLQPFLHSDPWKRKDTELFDKLKSSENAKLQLEVAKFLYTPENLLNKWGDACFSESAAFETEEKILRRVASQCNLPGSKPCVSLNPLHLGTRYLDSQYFHPNQDAISVVNIAQPTADSKSSSSASASSSQNKSSDNHNLASQLTTAQSNKFENLNCQNVSSELDSKQASKGDNTPPAEITFTAQYLIDKVKKSKRQRGVCVDCTGPMNNIHQSGQFNPSYLNALKSAFQKNEKSFWASTDDSKRQESSSKKNLKPSPNSFDQISMSDFCRSAFSTSANITSSLVNSLTVSLSDIYLAGDSPNLNLAFFKKYVPPLNVATYGNCEDLPKGNLSGPTAIIDKPLAVPDLIITTLEIPWKSLVSEFQTIRSEDMGLSFYGVETPHVLQSTTENGLLLSTAADANHSDSKARKSDSKLSVSRARDRSANHSVDDPKRKIQSNKDIAPFDIISRSKSMTEVVAPSFRDISLPLLASSKHSSNQVCK
jgi:hypothetical protein